MVKSMTGFGKSELTTDKKTVRLEIKTVNHRYCDINVKISHRYSFAEEQIKSAIKKRICRGKVEVAVFVDNFGQFDNDIVYNKDAAQKYYDALKSMIEEFDLSGGGIPISLLASMPDVIKSVPSEQKEEEILAEFEKLTEEALDDICAMREIEGRRLAEDILHRADIIEEIKNKIEVRAPEISKEYAQKIKDRITEILDGMAEVSEDRILLEAAVFADKANVTEELVRLDSHIKQLRAFINSDEPGIGKKIDFLIQEMNREANTIGSKSNDNEITSLVIDLKAEIEKVREQVQNIE